MPVLTHAKRYRDLFLDVGAEGKKCSDFIRENNENLESKSNEDVEVKSSENLESKSNEDVESKSSENLEPESKENLKLKLLKLRLKSDYRQQRYNKFSEVLEEAIDAHYNIVRYVERKPNKLQVVRDATEAWTGNEPDLAKKINRCRIETYNTLLRTLDILRAIDFALIEKIEEVKNHLAVLRKQAEDVIEEKMNYERIIQVYEQERKALQNNFADFTQQLIEKSIQFESRTESEYKGEPEKAKNDWIALLEEEEKYFNTNTLCRVVHNTHLSEGCSSVADFSGLLFVFRKKAALLDEALPLVTISFDQENQVLHRITQKPITRKLTEQKDNIKNKLSGVVLFPQQTDSHRAQPVAVQQLNVMYAPLLKDDTRMIGAQSRKHLLVGGVRNAYLVKDELCFDVKEVKEEKDLFVPADREHYFVRSGTLSYVGKGDNEQEIVDSIVLNVQQIENFVAEELKVGAAERSKIRMHLTSLITNDPFEKQKFVQKTLCSAANKTKSAKRSSLGPVDPVDREDKGESKEIKPQTEFAISLAPCNVMGMSRDMNFAPEVNRALDDETKNFQIKRNLIKGTLSRARRYNNIVSATLALESQAKNVVNVLSCMSGEDRTGTVAENLSRRWREQRYIEQKKNPKNVESIMARSRNAAAINGHCHRGARGLKVDSKASGLFSPATDVEMYEPSAQFNKKRPLDNTQLTAIVSKRSEVAELELKAALSELNRIKGKQSDKMQIECTNFYSEVKKQAASSFTPKDASIAIRSVREVNGLLNGDVEYSDHLRHIARTLKTKKRWAQVGGLIIGILGIAFIAAAALLAVPSCGSSLLLGCLLGLKALSFFQMILTVAVGTPSSVLVGVGLMGSGAHLYSQKGASKNMGFFSSLKGVCNQSTSERFPSLIEVNPPRQSVEFKR